MRWKGVHVENREPKAPEHPARRLVSSERLPYRSPVLVEYGNVSKLTEGSVGSMPDFFSMTGMAMCL
jgi:hypothetical protein